jgi:mannitol/fructose-specific phosphotransferase system IIA component (Ntr-type)
MRLTDILLPECVRVPVSAVDKHGIIDERGGVLADHAEIDDAESLREAVWSREQIRTTGIGHGLAVPHGKCAGCSRLCMAVGKVAPPVEFGAIDKKPVELVFLLASPIDQTGPHIQALASISRMLTAANVRDQFRTAQTADELYALIKSHDAAG